MGNIIFGVDIAALVAKHVGAGMFDVTITRQVAGTRDPASLSGGIPQTPVQIIGVKGFWDDYSTRQIDGQIVLVGDRRAVLFGDTLGGYLPQAGDAITIHEQVGDATLYVQRLESRDPAAATFTYQCGDRRGPDGQ